jgi:hypothetical protein
MRTVALGILAAAFFLQSYSASLLKSPTFDEPVHIAAGLSYVEAGRILVNPEHPPLLKEISGTFLRAAGVRWPESPQAAALLKGDLRLARPVGNAIIADNGPDRVLFWARLPFILLATLLAFALYLLGRVLLGETAALGALLLYALDPNLVAHSFLVTTDVGLAAFVIAFLLTLWRYLERPSAGRIVWCGLALGAALGAKFSAVALLPVTCVLLVAAAVWPIDAGTNGLNPPTPPPGRNHPCPCGSGRKYKHCHGREAPPIPASIRRPRLPWRYGFALAGMCAVAFASIQVVYLLPRDPFKYAAGIRLVNANHDPTALAYLAGRLAPREPPPVSWTV